MPRKVRVCSEAGEVGGWPDAGGADPGDTDPGGADPGALGLAVVA